MKTVANILKTWPSRSDVLEDVRHVSPDLQIVAIHRWAARNSIPARYWQGLLAGATRRGLPITADCLISAHAQEETAP